MALEAQESGDASEDGGVGMMEPNESFSFDCRVCVMDSSNKPGGATLEGLNIYLRRHGGELFMPTLFLPNSTGQMVIAIDLGACGRLPDATTGPQDASSCTKGCDHDHHQAQPNLSRTDRVSQACVHYEGELKP